MYMAIYGRVVLRAIQSTSRNVQAKNGKTPYNVSLSEWECRSIARKTLMQKPAATRDTTAPGIDIGRCNHPTRLNHACFICVYLYDFISPSYLANTARIRDTYKLNARTRSRNTSSSKNQVASVVTLE